MVLAVNDRTLPVAASTGSSQSIAAFDIRDNDTVVVRHRGSSSSSSAVASSSIRSVFDIPANITPDQLLQLCNSNPRFILTLSLSLISALIHHYLLALLIN